MENYQQVTGCSQMPLEYHNIPSDMSKVFDQPSILEYGSKNSRELLLKMCQQVYACRGRNYQSYTMEIDTLVTRLYDKMYRNYTIGDIKCFGEKLIEGEITLHNDFISVTNMLIAWRSYVNLRISFLPDDNKYEDEDVSIFPDEYDDEYANEVVKRIRAYGDYMRYSWDNYIANWENQHNQTYSVSKDNLVNGINLGYAKWCKEKKAAFDEMWNRTHII